jgi:hypothetical protein
VRQLADPEGFFTQLGEDVAGVIEQLARELAGPAPPGRATCGG